MIDTKLEDLGVLTHHSFEWLADFARHLSPIPMSDHFQQPAEICLTGVDDIPRIHHHTNRNSMLKNIKNNSRILLVTTNIYFLRNTVLFSVTVTERRFITMTV